MVLCGINKVVDTSQQDSPNLALGLIIGDRILRVIRGKT